MRAGGDGHLRVLSVGWGPSAGPIPDPPHAKRATLGRGRSRTGSPMGAAVGLIPGIASLLYALIS